MGFIATMNQDIVCELLDGRELHLADRPILVEAGFPLRRGKKNEIRGIKCLETGDQIFSTQLHIVCTQVLFQVL